MTNRISDSLLSQLSELIASEMGLHFPRARWPELERGLGLAAREFGFQDASACVHWLTSSPLTKNQIEILARQLTVGETYFFREKKSLEILQEHILPELIRSRRGTDRRLRIWSAGCATGEEPYSIAVVLSQLIPDLKDWSITILATDINPGFLQKASAGIFSEWSFRDTPPGIKESYFKRTRDGGFAILPQLKQIVTFAYFNLAIDAYPSLSNNTTAMDVILCRNVLMYFAPGPARKVIQNLYCTLVDGGWLIVSPSETSHDLYLPFVTVNFPDAILYKKDGRKPPLAEGCPSRPDNEANASVPPPVVFVTRPEPEIPFPQDSEDPLPLEIEEQKIRGPQPPPSLEAFALYEQGGHAGVAEELKELGSRHPESPGAMALLARAYANQGHLAAALEWCDKAIAADKLNAGLRYLRATIRQEQGANDEAMVSLKQALYLDPNFVLAHFALGNLALRQGKLKESDKHFANALWLLSAYRPEDVLPESEGVTAGRLMQIIRSTSKKPETRNQKPEVSSLPFASRF
jgi:chemotaxis protein methyltransferase CheR